MPPDRDPKGGAVEIPDLELPPPSQKPTASPEPPPSGQRRTAPAGAGKPAEVADYFGSGMFDADDFGGPSLALDDGPIAAGPAHAPGMNLGGDFDMDADSSSSALGLASMPPGPAVAAPAPKIASRVELPRGATPDRSTLRIDEVELAVWADYGAAPQAAWATPAYAVRVALRRRQLGPELRRREQALADAETRRDALLVQLVERLRPTLDADSKLARTLDRVREIEQVTSERSTALAGARSERDARQAELDAELARLEAQARSHEADAAKIAEEVAAREEQHKRADVRLKRVHIDMRAAKQQVELAVSRGGAAPEELARRLAELEAQAREMQPGVDALRRDLDEANARLGAVRGQIDAISRAARGVGARKAELDRTFRKQIEARSEGLGAAERELHAALSEAGRALLAGGGIEIDPALLEAIRTADAETARTATEAEKCLRALDAYDRDASRRGWQVMGAALLGIVLLIVLAKIL